MDDAKTPHPDETPRTTALIAELDKEPESRLVFVIRRMVNHAKELERDLAQTLAQRDSCYERLKSVPSSERETSKLCYPDCRCIECRAAGRCVANDPAPQVPAMATSGASRQNVEADRAEPHDSATTALCDERLAGGSNPADAGPCVNDKSSEPVAWIEHHKGGDNLRWEPIDHPYAKATPLYRTPESATRESVIEECAKVADECRVLIDTDPTKDRALMWAIVAKQTADSLAKQIRALADSTESR